MKHPGVLVDKDSLRTILNTTNGPAEAPGGLKIGHSTTEEAGVLRINSTSGNLEWYHPIDEEWKEAGAEQGGSAWYIEALDIPSVDAVPVETSNLVVHELYKEVL